MPYQKYTELDVWKQGAILAFHVYALTSKYPKAEQFELTSQIRRCVVSAPSNIAEGWDEKQPEETLHFLSIARGSLFELKTQLYISKELLFITDDQPVICLSKIESIWQTT